MGAWKLVLSAGDQAKVLAEIYDIPQAGRLGVEKTFARVAMYHYWPEYYPDICSYVAPFQECQAHKGSQQAPAGLITERNIEEPWVVVAANIMDPKPPSRSGNKYFIMFEDLLIVNRWGCARGCLTDNGTEFANRMVTDRLMEYGIVESTFPPNHAQANLVELVKRYLWAMINSFLKGDHRDWDLHLGELGFALNTAVHASYPAFLNLCRNSIPPLLLCNHLEDPQSLSPEFK